MTEDRARVLGDWAAARGRNLTDILATHGHGDHWFAAGLLPNGGSELDSNPRLDGEVQ